MLQNDVVVQCVMVAAAFHWIREERVLVDPSDRRFLVSVGKLFSFSSLALNEPESMSPCYRSCFLVPVFSLLLPGEM